MFPSSHDGNGSTSDDFLRVGLALQRKADALAEVDMDAHYTIAGWSPGIAWYLIGYVKVRDEDYEWTGIEEEDRDRVCAVMVGDDRVVEGVDVEDLQLIGEEDFCRGCGQVGCGCEVWA